MQEHNQLVEECLTILWEYIIEVQDIIATLRALLANPDRPGSVAALLAAGENPESIIREMIDKARGCPIRAGMENPLAEQNP